MKKSLSLVLAVLMVAALFVPIFTLTIAATGDGDSTATSYLIYQQDFDSVSADAEGMALMEQLGWYVPSAKVETDGATYSIVQKVGGKDYAGNDVINQSLRVNTLGAAHESFVNIFSSDVMAALRNSSFVLKYRLTYREETTNNDGYAAIIYNYNEMHGSVANGEGNEAYGIAAVRMCGTGLNAVYYPVAGADCAMQSIEKDPGSPNTMASRYDAISGQPSLYARLFGAQESNSDIRKGTSAMANRVLDIEVSYDYKNGVFVSINGVLVSEMNYDLQYNASIRDENLWSDFVRRNAGSTVALLTQPGIVADIDDITIETTDIQTVSDDADMPALLITEMLGYPTEGWGKFIEIYNPTDKPVDVANYSLIYSGSVTDGSATDAITGSRKTKYSSYIKLGDYFGQKLYNSTPQFFTLTAYNEEPSRECPEQWYFSDAEIAAIKEMGFDIEKASTTKYYHALKSDKPVKDGNNYTFDTSSGGTVYYLCNIYRAEIPFALSEAGEYVPQADGSYRLAYYVENWNTRYERGSSEYETNTMLNPGECMILFLSEASVLNLWKQGMINNGDTTTEYVPRVVGSKSYGFRYTFRNYGLSKETKILAIQDITIANTSGGTYAIGVSNDEAGNEIAYTGRYLSDMTYIESIVSYIPAISSGNQTESNAMQDTANIGHAGEITTNSNNSYVTSSDRSATYVYGVDASVDYRRGTLYTARSTIKNTYATVGKLAEYQNIIIGDFYKRADTTPPLMITEILPLTNNLEGEEMNAFAAMELTNTSGELLNVYDYSLVRNVAGVPGAKAGNGFKYSTALKAGNPVQKGDGNGAYYYFAEDSVSNPETCVLQPGESVVVWFITADTYASYYTDDEFGVEYFRQYWVNNGCPDMGIKNTDGEYAVKVVAVDGCADEAYNAPNYARVFAPAIGTYDSKDRYQNDTSAIYGVAKIAGEVADGTVIANSDVVSIAYFGLASIYYELNKTALAAADGSDTIYYANVLKCHRIPVNTGMRYVAGMTYNNRISAMKLGLKVQQYTYSNTNVYTTTNPNTNLELTMKTASANQPAGLGTLEGAEAYCVRESLLLGTKNEETNTIVYRYFAENRNAIATLEGAAVSTTAGTAKLRFDSVIRLDTFAALAATYGEHFKFGTLIVKTSELTDETSMNKEALLALGAKDVKSDLLYYTDDYAVLGASIEVAAADYDTEYTAVAYMEVMTDDYYTHFYYSFDTAVRSVSMVANAALKDTKTEKDDVYRYEMNGKYSRFTEEERQVLQGYLG